MICSPHTPITSPPGASATWNARSRSYSVECDLDSMRPSSAESRMISAMAGTSGARAERITGSSGAAAGTREG